MELETYRIWFFFMSSKVSQRSDVLENVCTALLEELTTCNTTCTVKANCLERRENTKKAFNVPKASEGIWYQLEYLVLCWKYLCVGCEVRSVQCYGNRICLSVWHTVFITLFIPLWSYKMTSFSSCGASFLHSLLMAQQSAVPVTGVSLRMWDANCKAIRGARLTS